VTYYITRVIIPPLDRCFSLLGAEVESWYYIEQFITNLHDTTLSKKYLTLIFPGKTSDGRLAN
jgi:hypothetical protein